MKAHKTFVALGVLATITLSGCAQTQTTPAAAVTSVAQDQTESAIVTPIPEPLASTSSTSPDASKTETGTVQTAQEPSAVSQGDAAIAAEVVADADLVELLNYLVQEEKLAKDLYTQLAQTSGARQFANIKKSEAKHVSSVQKLLASYGISDPTIGLAAGEFANSELQDLYDSLLASGSADYAGAIAAGVAVEETDIADIKGMLTTDLPADVEQVLNNLLSASYNHLAAFSKA